MKIAIFGKCIDECSINRLSVLMNQLCDLQSVEWWLYNPFYNEYKDLVKFPNGIKFSGYSDIAKDIDILLSLGGDGTFLNAITIVQDTGIPIAGINLGRLGFLTTESVRDSNEWINRLISGDYTIEKRTILKVSAPESDDINYITPSNTLFPYALNEISIQRVAPAMLEIHLSVNGDQLPVYWADGILIATATGSTAYSLSVGGPVVTPDSKVLIISPVAPHNLNVRPLIVPQNSKIELSFTGRGEEAQLTIDNRFFKVRRDTVVRVEAADFMINCVTINNNFIKALNQKLLWGEDKRNLSV